LSAGPSAACDPEVVINKLRAQCRDAITSAFALIETIKPALRMPERNGVKTKGKEATALGNTDKYRDGYTVTPKLARLIGRLDRHRGINPQLRMVESCLAKTIAQSLK